MELLVEEDLAEEVGREAGEGVLEEVDDGAEGGVVGHGLEEFLEGVEEGGVGGVASLEGLDLLAREVHVVVLGQPVPPEPYT